MGQDKQQQGWGSTAVPEEGEGGGRGGVQLRGDASGICVPLSACQGAPPAREHQRLWGSERLHHSN